MDLGLVFILVIGGLGVACSIAGWHYERKHQRQRFRTHYDMAGKPRRSGKGI